MNNNLEQLNNLFWNAEISDLTRGYIKRNTSPEYICLCCGTGFTEGIIYRINESYCTAEKACKEHILKVHNSMFTYLLHLDKKITGIPEKQKKILLCLYEGLADKEIAGKLDINSASTVRNHRFHFREKQKQAKIFLAIMNCLQQRKEDQGKFMEIHRGAAMIDTRYAITKEEQEKYLKKYFPYGLDNELSEFPKKQKRKLIILNHIIKRFELNRKYTEREVNEILKSIFHDYVTIRRYLIEYGFMERKQDGSCYWVKV